MKSKREVIFEGDPGFIEDPEGYDATEDIVRVFIYDGMVSPFGTGYSECQQVAMNPRFRTAVCRGPALVDPGNLKRGRRRRGSGNNCLIKC